MRFYTASKLGSKRAYTREGFLVCLDVPIARTGEMLYAGSELPELVAGPDGLIRVERKAEQVFDPVSLASFVGKPTTNDHPPQMVGTTNFRSFTSGSASNVRRGEGDEADLVIADLMWCDAGTIKAIEGGKDEISLGYDAEYEMIAPGRYRQHEITGNHIALVDEGRCGERCAIGDSAGTLQTTQAADAVLAPDPAPSCGCGGGHHHHDAQPARTRKRKTRDMATKKLKSSMLDKLRRTFAAKDEAGFEEAMAETQEAVEATQEEQDQAAFAAMIGSAVAEAIAPITERLDSVEGFVADRKTKDAAEEAAEKAKKDEDERKAAEAAKAATKDNADVMAFLSSKGLTEADAAAVLAMVKKDEPAATTVDDALLGNPEPDGSNDPGTNGTNTHTDPDVAASQGSTGPGTTDSASLLTEFRDTIAKAEIVFPGVKVPVFDAKAKGKSTIDAMCALRRRALQSAFDSAERKGNVSPFLPAKPDISKMTCDAVKMAFAGAAELAKRANSPVPNIVEVNAATRDAVRGSVKSMQSAADTLWKR